MLKQYAQYTITYDPTTNILFNNSLRDVKPNNGHPQSDQANEHIPAPIRCLRRWE